MRKLSDRVSARGERDDGGAQSFFPFLEAALLPATVYTYSSAPMSETFFMNATKLPARGWVADGCVGS